MGEALVFSGVVGEVCAEWGSTEHKKFEQLSSIILIIGLAVSLAALIGTNRFFDRVLGDLELQAADANKRAGEANERAARADLESAQLRLEADRLEEEISEQGPRNLILRGKRKEMLLTSLRTYREQKVEIRICVFGEKETRDTADLLTQIFVDAQWNVSPNSPNWGESNCLLHGPNETTPVGIWVGTPNPRPASQALSRTRKLAELLN